MTELTTLQAFFELIKENPNKTGTKTISVNNSRVAIRVTFQQTETDKRIGAFSILAKVPPEKKSVESIEMLCDISQEYHSIEMKFMSLLESYFPSVEYTPHIEKADKVSEAEYDVVFHDSFAF